MSLVITDAQQEWIQAREARRAFSVEFPWHDGLPARYVATEPLVFNDPNHFFKIGPGSAADGDKVNAATCQPLIDGETAVRSAIASHIFGDSTVERGLIELALVDSDLIAAWDFEDWVGRPAILRWGDPRWERVFGSTFFSGAEEAHIQIMEAVVRGVRHAPGQVIVEMQPQITLFDVLINDRFKADEAQGVIPASPEAAGEVVPVMLGNVSNAPAVPIDSATLQFWRAALVSQSVDLEVRDNNVVLTLDTDYTQPEWEIVDLDNAIGKITWSGTQHNFFGGSADPKELKHTMRLAFAVAGQENLFNLGSQTSNATLNDAMGDATINVGLYIDEEIPFVNALQALADAGGLGWFIGAQVVSDERQNKAIFRRIDPPANEPIVLISKDRIDSRVAKVWKNSTGGTRLSENGLIETVPPDTPRKNHHLNGTFDRYLSEPAAMNILVRSNPDAVPPTGWVLDDSDGAGSSSLVSHLGLNAVKLVRDTSGKIRIRDNLPTLDPETTYTLSVFFDPERTFISSGETRLIWLQGLTNTTGGTTADIAEIDDEGRLSTTFTTGGSGDDLDGVLFIGVGVVNPGVGEAVFTGWQLEKGAGATSLIITADAPESRDSDNAKLTGPDFDALGLKGGGSIVVEAITAASQNQTIVSANDGTLNERASIRALSDNRLSTIGVSGGTIQWNPGFGSIPLGVASRAALAFDTNDVAWATSGAIAGTDSDAALPSPTQLEIGDGGLEHLNGGIRALIIHPNRPSNAETAVATVVGRKPFNASGPESFRFDESSIDGGVEIERASEALRSIAVARRISWADTGGDVIDPSLSAADKIQLGRQWETKVYSLRQGVTDAPDTREPIRLELVDEASQDIEGMRLARVFDRGRLFYRWRALTGALQVQPGDVVGLSHDTESALGPLLDENGQPILDAAGLPVVLGRSVLIKVLEESYPSGSVNVEAWA